MKFRIACFLLQISRASPSLINNCDNVVNVNINSIILMLLSVIDVTTDLFKTAVPCKFPVKLVSDFPTVFLVAWDPRSGRFARNFCFSPRSFSLHNPNCGGWPQAILPKA